MQKPNHPMLKLPAKWMASILVQIVLMCRGWRLPDYFSLREKWHAISVGIEPDVMQFTAREMKADDTVLDIGANVGLLARHFCKCVGSGGRVLAFEPAPENFQALRYNLRRYSQAEVVDLAISDNNELATFYLHRTSGTGNSLVPHALGMRRIQVQCQTLDMYLSHHTNVRPDWVKIDVEGGEFYVLRGMHETVRNFPDLRIIVELCPQHLGGIKQAEGLISELQGMSFGVHLIHDDGATEPFRSVYEHTDSFAPNGYVNILCMRKSK